MAVTGWPQRAGRPAFGVDMRDERIVSDPSREFSAAQANILFWQLGGMGVCCPLLAMRVDWTGVNVWQILDARFGWDQVVYQDLAANTLPGGNDGILSISESAGALNFEFDTSVLGRPDENGAQQSEVLAFQFGAAFVNLADGFSGRTRVQFTLQDPQNFEIITYLSGSFSREPFTVLVW